MSAHFIPSPFSQSITGVESWTIREHMVSVVMLDGRKHTFACAPSEINTLNAFTLADKMAQIESQKQDAQALNPA